MQDEAVLQPALFNYQDDARSNKHKMLFFLIIQTGTPVITVFCLITKHRNVIHEECKMLFGNEYKIVLLPL